MENLYNTINSQVTLTAFQQSVLIHLEKAFNHFGKDFNKLSYYINLEDNEIFLSQNTESALTNIVIHDNESFGISFISKIDQKDELKFYNESSDYNHIINTYFNV
jgi:hypothetical protein